MFSHPNECKMLVILSDNNLYLICGKYRVTYVTGSQCEQTVRNLGADFHDSGTWYFPNLDPSISRREFMRNFTAGLMIHALPSLDSLIQKDRPDLILGVVFGCVCSVIAEKHQIPFATIWASGVPHPSVYKEGQRMNTSPSWLPFLIPSDDTPDVIVKALGALHLAFLVTLNTISTSNELKLFNSLRSDLGLPPMNNFVHLMGLYPAIAHAGEPVFPQKEDTRGHIVVTGMLPVSQNRRKLPEDLFSFIANSDRPILYISMGTYAIFSHQQFQLMLDALERQDNYNVIWSHRNWTDSMESMIDARRFFVKKKLPQAEILAQNKVHVFLTHCGSSSLTEGILAEKVFIAAPQMRDQHTNTRSLTSHDYGIVVPTNPSASQLLTALEQIHTNYHKYLENVRLVKQISTEGAQVKLRKTIDYLISQKHTLSFGVEDSLAMSFTQAVAILLCIPIVCCSLVILTVLLLWLRCGKQKIKKL
ncbi:NDP-glycosyltransferase YjiC-like isoform X2 [Convolutriloba macropyga]|uniref:NDP-glycosyltransferase YjiC-like isoform X2 n=1 Tax=Convolutriloba macropyga TaxID=536237 RepID=UPI003F51C52C